MASIDNYPFTPKQEGSHEALEWRKAERAGYRLNKPIAGIRGLGNVIQAMLRGEAHSVFCLCSTCRVPITDADRRRWERMGLPGLDEPTVTVIHSPSGEPKRRRGKWVKRGKSGN